MMKQTARLRPLQLLLMLVILVAVGWVAYTASPWGYSSLEAYADGPTAAVRREPPKGTLSYIGEGEDAVAVLHLWGTPYEMGFAHGRLAREEVRFIVGPVLAMMALGGKWSMADLDEAWAKAEPFIPTEYVDELHGLADGAEVPFKSVCRMHIVPELSEFHCSFFASWGAATKDGHLIQIRALDYATEAGIQKHPALIVYEPDEGVPFVNVAWLGFVGMVTGMNEEGIAMSEIGDDFGKETDTLEGEPMCFLMRDVIQNSKTLDEAVTRVREADRTSSYLYCIGDGKIPDARALATCHDKCDVYDPSTLPFPHLRDTVYMSMGLDSGWNQKVHDVLAKGDGQIDMAFAEQQVMCGLGTGDLHAVAFDVTDRRLDVANATMDGQNGFEREFVSFDLAKFLEEESRR
jgi:isopenicillin-N N-acyltransferase like protein